MRKFNKILSALALILTLSVSVVAYAEDMRFTDVTEQTPYYSSIQRIYDKGIITGYADNTFRPNDKITVAEGITLAEKLFGDTSTLPIKWEEWFTDSCGWDNHISLDGYPFRGDYGEVMTYETASELLLKLNDISLINPYMWDIKKVYGGFSAYTDTMYVRGYTNQADKYISFVGLTRAEYCNMLCFMLDYDGTSTIAKEQEPIIEPIIYGGAEIDGQQDIIINAQSALISIPENIRQDFVDNGFSVVLVPSEKWQSLFDDKYVGIYHHSNKAIYIKIGYYDSLPHEFGHYVHYTLQNKIGYDISANDTFKKQLAELKFMNDTYFMTDDAEFFAEAFEEYCNQNNALKDKCESIYSYVSKAVNAFYVLQTK